jgi:hypothetical protein
MTLIDIHEIKLAQPHERPLLHVLDKGENVTGTTRRSIQHVIRHYS